LEIAAAAAELTYKSQCKHLTLQLALSVTSCQVSDISGQRADEKFDMTFRSTRLPLLPLLMLL